MLEMDDIKDQYLKKLQQELKKESEQITLDRAFALASETLESVISDIQASRAGVLDELATNPIYAHAVFGCFGTGYGHYVKKIIGLPIIRKYANEEKVYTTLFEDELSGPEFQARFAIIKELEGVIIKLAFNDRQGDRRGAANTSYTLLMPYSKSEQIIKQINHDPSILIDLFRKVFPDYDRSNGKLAMHKIQKQFLFNS